MTGTCEPLRKEPAILFCFYEGCKMTAWEDCPDDWSEDEHRHMLVWTGRAPGLINPCPVHRQEEKP